MFWHESHASTYRIACKPEHTEKETKQNKTKHIVMYSKELSTLPDVIFFFFLCFISPPSLSFSFTCNWKFSIQTNAMKIFTFAILYPTTPPPLLSSSPSRQVHNMHFLLATQHATLHSNRCVICTHVKGCNLLLFSMELVFIVIFILIISIRWYFYSFIIIVMIILLRFWFKNVHQNISMEILKLEPVVSLCIVCRSKISNLWHFFVWKKHVMCMVSVESDASHTVNMI